MTTLGRTWTMLAVSIAAGLFVLVVESHGHDSAKWIQEKHPGCCGPNDCIPVPRPYVVRTKDGWRVLGIKGSVLKGDIKDSPDLQPWACRRLWNNTLRCLFMPPVAF